MWKWTCRVRRTRKSISMISILISQNSWTSNPFKANSLRKKDWYHPEVCQLIYENARSLLSMLTDLYITSSQFSINHCLPCVISFPTICWTIYFSSGLVSIPQITVNTVYTEINTDKYSVVKACRNDRMNENSVSGETKLKKEEARWPGKKSTSSWKV